MSTKRNRLHLLVCRMEEAVMERWSTWLRPIPRHAIAATIAAMTSMMLFGCATPPPKQEEVKLVWPPPPLTPRVKFVRSIVSEDSLERDSTFSEQAYAFLTGERMPINHIAEPMGLAVSDDTERLYVSDNMQRTVFVFDFKKKQFWKYNDVGVPGGIALDAQERLYVVDMLGKSVRIFGPDRKLVNQIVDETVTKPTGIAVDKVNGKVYLVDTSNKDAEEMNVKVYDLQGKRIGQIGGKPGGAFGEFSYPTYATVDDKGYLYVSDTMNARVQKFDASGKHVYTYGQMGSAWGEFDKPKGVAVDGFGNLYVVDSGWSNVQIFNEHGQILLFFGGRGPGPGMLKNPLAIAIDRNNRIYVGDYLNHRVEVYDLVNTTANDSFLKPPSKNPVPKGAK